MLFGREQQCGSERGGAAFVMFVMFVDSDYGRFEQRNPSRGLLVNGYDTTAMLVNCVSNSIFDTTHMGIFQYCSVHRVELGIDGPAAEECPGQFSGCLVILIMVDSSSGTMSRRLLVTKWA